MSVCVARHVLSGYYLLSREQKLSQKSYLVEVLISRTRCVDSRGETLPEHIATPQIIGALLISEEGRIDI